ncbi:M24 family metallopeptidase [Congregibacter sp.]|jgi:Xaa-Pro dipeptidase|uniref:M24 family metallopeptidase n=1 Tax=Congregibacter sp. TaxID=2744308 RepID=UPI0039E67C5C
MATRRQFLQTSGVAALGAASVAYGASASGKESVAAAASSPSGDSAKLLVKRPQHPTPSTLDRLPLEWHQGQVQRLQKKLRDRGLDGILISDRWNIIYYTGLWHTTTERPFSCFIPTDELAVHWFHPGLDFEMVRSWWFTDGDYYFDYPASKDGYPDQGKVSISQAVDPIEWQLQGLARRGYGAKKIGLSQPPTVGALRRMQEVLPEATFEDVSDICIGMRRVKTPEELALSQRAFNYFSQIHAWTRDYILQHGTDLTDFKIGMAAKEYGTELIMRDIKRDGRPHTAVGISIGIGCRTGIGTAFPHPNQFHYNKVKKGDSLQVSGVVRLAGCGGELYCPYQIGPWPSEWEKAWEVMARGSEMQIEMSKVGTPCQEIARAIHAYQVKEGMQDYLYQRVAHGEGWEGHQQPYISLGDTTLLEKNMTFSMEPGLFNPDKGLGYNPSDNVVVDDESGWVQGSVPNLTKEWAHLKI